MADTLPVISVVTPSLNQGRFIEQTLRSVLDQDYPHLEYFVIDGGSTDGTLDILREYENRLQWTSEPDRGQADAIKKGFARCRGKILAWLNSDDYYEPGALRTIGQFFADHSDAELVYGDYFLEFEDGHRELRRKIDFDPDIFVYAYQMIAQPAAFWRRSAYEAVGGIAPALKFSMDYNLFIRLARRRGPVHLSVPLATFRLHPSSKSRTLRDQAHAEMVQIQKNLGLYPRFPRLKRLFCRAKTLHRFRCELGQFKMGSEYRDKENT